MVESGTLLRCYTNYTGIEGSNPSLSATLRIVICCLLLSLASCGEQESADIEWQLPLTAQEDAHGSDKGGVEGEVPVWAVKPGRATLVLLDKATTHLLEIEIELGTPVPVPAQNIQINLLGLASGLRLQSGSYILGENVHNPAAFVEVVQGEEIIYRGWLYQEFPELFGPDSPDWKLWLKSISFQPLSAKEAKKG